jgi:hypothetical protein
VCRSRGFNDYLSKLNWNIINKERSSSFPCRSRRGQGPNRIVDIYVTELGYVMASIFNEEKKVYVNYICGEIEDILPTKIKLKVEEVHQSSEQQPSKDDRFSSSL